MAGVLEAQVARLVTRRSGDSGGWMRAGDLVCARDALRQVSGIEAVVSFRIDGSPMLGAFELDEVEHMRRVRQGIGAVTSCGLLHGLWLLPSGGTIRAAALPSDKLQRVRDAPHTARESAGRIMRTYSPPGVVRAVAFAGRCIERTVSRAARFTPIVQRFALVEDGGESVPLRVEYEAREWGVGIVALNYGDRAERVVPASAAVVGVPSVYRWWIAELAYERLLYENAQPVNWAFGFSGPWNPASP